MPTVQKRNNKHYHKNCKEDDTGNPTNDYQFLGFIFHIKTNNNTKSYKTENKQYKPQPPE